MQTRKSLKVLLLAGLMAVVLGQAASPVYPPAFVQFTVKDEAGRPLPGAQVHLARRDLDQKRVDLVTLQTDAEGKVQWSRIMPPGKRGWDEELTVDKPGVISQTQSLTLFTGARIEKTFILETERPTVLTITGPDGKPVADIPLNVSYEKNNGSYQDGLALGQPGWRTDERGQYTWRHGALPKGFSLKAGPHSEKFADAPAAGMKITAAELQSASAQWQPHPLQGRLLLSDGMPAAGWFVGQDSGFGSSAMIISGSLVIYTLSADKLIPVGKDGSFEASVGSNVILLSPQGIPVIYDVCTELWPPGPHHVTLTLPPMHQMLRGQLVDDAGKPAAGIPLRAQNISAAGRTWSLSVSGAEQERLAAAGIPFGVVTDVDGKYEVPVPAGTWARLAPGPAWSNELVDGTVTTYRKRSQAALVALPLLKDIAVRFEDEKGMAIEAPFLTAKGFVGARPVNVEFQNLSAPLNDARGRHFFVPLDATSIEISLDGQGWNAASRTIPLTGEAGQEATVSLDSALRWKPAGGRLLDPAGKGVAGASVWPFTREKYYDGRMLRAMKSPAVTTDADGRFEFPAAPDAFELQVSRFDDTGNSQDLPGWSEPVAITKENRQVEIRLKPAGSIRITLAENLNRDPGQVYLERINSDLNDISTSAYLVADPAARALVARRAVPGTYKVGGLISELGDLTEQRISVEQDKETVLDWSKIALAQFPYGAERTAGITVMSDGKPLSGAQVVVLEELWPREAVAGWIKEWIGADAARRDVLHKRIIDAAGVARELLDAMLGDEGMATAALAKELAPSGNWQSDSLVVLTRDLSDDDGIVRFRGRPGGQFVAVAICPGRSIGWQTFTLPAAPDTKNAAITMRPTRTLQVPLPPWSPPKPGDWDPRELHVGIIEPAGMERRALMRVLGATLGGMEWPGSRANVKTHTQLNGRWLSPTVMAVEDLPVGASCDVQITEARMDTDRQQVRIEMGTGPQEVKVAHPR